MFRSRPSRQPKEADQDSREVPGFDEDLAGVDGLTLASPEELVLPNPDVLVLPNPDVLVIPKPRGRAKSRSKKSAPLLEELLAPDPTHSAPASQRCLAVMMQSVGHSLDLGCRLCFTNCVYAPPCGCKGYYCVDRQTQEPLVVFTETVQASPRGWKKMFQRNSEAESSVLAKVVRKIFRPWTWFWGK